MARSCGASSWPRGGTRIRGRVSLTTVGERGREGGLIKGRDLPELVVEACREMGRQQEGKGKGGRQGQRTEVGRDEGHW